jgi:FAD/FMN-containing dehydrogenase
MVTAKGDVIEVSKDSHPELFWGIRGAGANFGIITSATYQAHPLTDDGDVFVGEFIVPAGREVEYFQLLESLSPIQAKVAAFMMINYNSTTNRVRFLGLLYLTVIIVLMLALDPSTGAVDI